MPIAPNDAEIESSVFEAEYVEEGEDEEKEISYVALLAASGMFALILVGRYEAALRAGRRFDVCPLLSGV